MHLGPARGECLSLSAEPCGQDCPACPSQAFAFETVGELLELTTVVPALWTVVPDRVSPSCTKKHLKFTEEIWGVIFVPLTLPTEKRFKRQLI